MKIRDNSLNNLEKDIFIQTAYPGDTLGNVGLGGTGQGVLFGGIKHLDEEVDGSACQIPQTGIRKPTLHGLLWALNWCFVSNTPYSVEDPL